MVKESGVYLFIGQDYLSKDSQLARLKQEFLPPEIQDFNFDILYAKDTPLKALQEKLLFFPVKAKKRIVVLRDIGNAREEVRQFLLRYLKAPSPGILLVLDIERRPPKDEFIATLARCARVFSFRETVQADAFTLSRAIQSKNTPSSLVLLHELLENGEKPERILGGLRYALEARFARPFPLKRAFRFLLGCDIEIKTGKLKPEFALERLVVRLCALA